MASIINNSLKCWKKTIYIKKHSLKAVFLISRLQMFLHREGSLKVNCNHSNQNYTSSRCKCDFKGSHLQFSTMHLWWIQCETVICLCFRKKKKSFQSLFFTIANHFAALHPSFCQHPNALDLYNLDPQRKVTQTKLLAALTTCQIFNPSCAPSPFLSTDTILRGLVNFE